jgi:hypothetical protein
MLPLLLVQFLFFLSSSCIFFVFSLFFLHRKLLNLTVFFLRSFQSIISDIVCRPNIYFRLFLGTSSNFRKATVSFIMSVCLSSHMEQLGYHRKEFYEIWGLNIIWNLSRKSNFCYNVTRIATTLHEDQHTFMMSRSAPLMMRNVSDKRFSKKKIKMHILFQINFFFENRAVYEILSKNTLRPDSS